MMKSGSETPPTTGQKWGLISLACAGLGAVTFVLLCVFGQRLRVIQDTSHLSPVMGVVDHGMHWLPWAFLGTLSITLTVGLACGWMARRERDLPPRLGRFGLLLNGLVLAFAGMFLVMKLISAI